MEVTQRADLRDHLAAERTFLAWIRTGIALMGFGFVVARFGLFLQEFQITQHVHAFSPRSYGFSRWFGTSLIAVGVMANAVAAWHHARLVRELNRGGAPPSRPSTEAIAIASILALVGLAMVMYLLSVQGSVPPRAESLEEISMTSGNAGIIDIPSNHSVDETVEKLKGILQAKGVILFALIDHSGEAKKAGLGMRPTKLLIFGNPKAGTPLMQAAPRSAIDLPLKILVWEDAQRKAWVTYDNPAYLLERHGLPADLLQNIAVVETLAAKGAE
jgi:uncharacterized protein (DUF302 family)/uncharacterized membrane protein YidH (DUF202 family)